MTLRLYGTPPTRALRPIWLINELDLACEIISVDVRSGVGLDPAFTALNPLGKVPALQDGDLIVTESVAIALYLAERYGNGRFVPTDTLDRAMFHQWLFFMATEVEQPLWRMALHSAIYPEAERIPGEMALAARDCRRALAVAEAHMQGRRTFVGDTVTVADFIAAYTLDWADEVGMLGDCPELSAFVATMYARPAAPLRIAEAFALLNAGQDAPLRRHPKET